jgi:hypothetical protein
MGYVRQAEYYYADERYVPSTSVFNLFNISPLHMAMATFPVTLVGFILGAALCMVSVIAGVAFGSLCLAYNLYGGLWWLSGVTLQGKSKDYVAKLEAAYGAMPKHKRKEYKSWMPKLYRRIANHEDISDAIETFSLYASMYKSDEPAVVDKFRNHVRDELEVARRTKEAMDELNAST